MKTAAKPKLDWSLRAAHRGDLESVLFLLEASHLPADGVEEAFGPNFVIAQANDEIVGVAGVELHTPWGLLRSVAVRDDMRGTGLGRVLVENRIEWARMRALAGLGLFTIDAAPFFDHLGFERIGRGEIPAPLRDSSEFSLVCPVSADVLILPLTDSNAQRKEQVRERYATAAERVAANGSACGSDAAKRRFGAVAYDDELLDSVPARVADASLGCGNPATQAGLRPGETVLDLGSGGGLDVLLAARLVGADGFVFGLDMTREMIELARGHQREAGVTNVRFLEGDIEAIPLPDQSVDVVMSNCVVNLATDKRAALREAYRVLRPGGRLAIADIVVRGAVETDDRRAAARVLGCAATSLEVGEYRALLDEFGFESIEIEELRAYAETDFTRLDPTLRTGSDHAAGPAWLKRVDGAFQSAFVRAVRP